jgi:hypothetical protein
MENAKKRNEPSADVCPLLSCHEIFEKWRSIDVSKLSKEERIEYDQDIQESRRRYDCAFDAVLSKTSNAELESFWDAFGGAPKGAKEERYRMSAPTMTPLKHRSTMEAKSFARQARATVKHTSGHGGLDGIADVYGYDGDGEASAQESAFRNPMHTLKEEGRMDTLKEEGTKQTAV